MKAGGANSRGSTTENTAEYPPSQKKRELKYRQGLEAAQQDGIHETKKAFRKFSAVLLFKHEILRQNST